jgi:hypothetical protein
LPVTASPIILRVNIVGGTTHRIKEFKCINGDLVNVLISIDALDSLFVFIILYNRHGRFVKSLNAPIYLIIIKLLFIIIFNPWRRFWDIKCVRQVMLISKEHTSPVLLVDALGIVIWSTTYFAAFEQALEQYFLGTVVKENKIAAANLSMCRRMSRIAQPTWASHM